MAVVSGAAGALEILWDPLLGQVAFQGGWGGSCQVQ